MDFKRLTDKAKGIVEQRGGTESVKEDANELKDIAKGPGSFADKAKAAVEAIKEPGYDDAPPSPAPTPAAQATPAEAERAAEKIEGEERGKHGHGGGHGRGGQGGGGRQGGGRHGGRGGGGAV